MYLSAQINICICFINFQPSQPPSLAADMESFFLDGVWGQEEKQNPIKGSKLRFGQTLSFMLRSPFQSNKGSARNRETNKASIMQAAKLRQLWIF